MKQDYSDIIDRIGSEPKWWDVYGVPRYDDPHDRIQPYMRKIACQGCGRVFVVCLVETVYYVINGGQTMGYRIGDPCPVDPNAFHVVFVCQSLVVWDKTTGGFYSDPLPSDWSYGDPPAHSCIGDTMSSVPDYNWNTDEDYRPEGKGRLRFQD